MLRIPHARRKKDRKRFYWPLRLSKIFGPVRAPRARRSRGEAIERPPSLGPRIEVRRAWAVIASFKRHDFPTRGIRHRDLMQSSRLLGLLRKMLRLKKKKLKQFSTLRTKSNFRCINATRVPLVLGATRFCNATIRSFKQEIQKRGICLISLSECDTGGQSKTARRCYGRWRKTNLLFQKQNPGLIAALRSRFSCRPYVTA